MMKPSTSLQDGNTFDSKASNCPELSVVMPCLNEADTLETCIRKAISAFREHHIDGEIIVADNGSTDGSQEIATCLGAHVVTVTEQGYGSALMGGIEKANGRFIIMGDADDSYDFQEIPKFVNKLREGFALVQGCRLPAGGGSVMPGAMPPLHRWWGNPMFSAMARRWFKAPIHDVYCGLRGFTKEHYTKLALRCTGMEFATEMIIKTSLYGIPIAEVPITLHPDGRKAHAPHLKTFRDGWRTLRFFLIYCPKWLFFIPGIVMLLSGLVIGGLALYGVTLGSISLDAHTLLFGSLTILCGYQAIAFFLLAKTFAIAEHLTPPDTRMTAFYRIFNLERGLAGGGFLLIVGLLLLTGAVRQWWDAGFGHLDYARTMRWVIPGSTLTFLGFQTVLFSFFASVLGMKRR